MDVDLHNRRQSHAQASTNDSSSAAQSMPSITINSSCQKPAASAEAAPQAGSSFLGLSHTSSSNQTPQPNPNAAQNSDLADAQHNSGTPEALLSAFKSQHTSVQHAPAQHDTAQHDAAQHDPGPLPMLASACPGWVCYAEKTHGSYILPYISTAKSPQVILPNPTTFSLLPPSWHYSPAAGLDRSSMSPACIAGPMFCVTRHQSTMVLARMPSVVVLIVCHLCSALSTGEKLLLAAGT